MGEKTIKTKAELYEMLAEAVRNTQSQSVNVRQLGPIRDAQPEADRKARPASKRTTKRRNARASARRKQPRR